MNEWWNEGGWQLAPYGLLLAFLAVVLALATPYCGINWRLLRIDWLALTLRLMRCCLVAWVLVQGLYWLRADGPDALDVAQVGLAVSAAWFISRARPEVSR